MDNLSPENKALIDGFMDRFDNVQELRDWVLTYLDIDLPMGHIDPDSNSSPAEWMFEAYTLYRKNQGDVRPGFIVLSCRDGYKTLTESIFAIIVMSHFGATIGHLAAIETQAKKAIQYVNQFIKKADPYLRANGRLVDSQNKRQVILSDKNGNLAYVNVIIATMQGANSEHTNILSIDEVDVMRFQKAYEEAKFIPVYNNGQHPLMILTSTRKFAFGMMEAEIQNRKETGLELLRWNIIDITERCPESRHRPGLPKQIRYIHPKLPLKNISVADYDGMDVDARQDYKRIEAYHGCASCPLLAVCQMRLAHRPKDDRGGLYKPISYTINQFRKIEPDMAEAQLMCWRPSQSGLLYGRFDEAPKTGNMLTIQDAWSKFTGGMQAPKDLQLRHLTDYLLQKGVKFSAMGDWGYRHAFAVVVSAQIGHEWWLIDSISVPGLDPDQQVAASKVLKEKYKISIWYMDTNQPGMCAMFKKNGMPCKKFTKDVQLGIACVKTQVVDAMGNRRLKLLEHPGNDWLLNGFRKHHYKLDSEGTPTNEPDDDEYADIMDSVRYGAQNMFARKGMIIVPPAGTPPSVFSSQIERSRNYESWMDQKARQLATDDTSSRNITNESRTLFVSFGDDDDNQ